LTVAYVALRFDAEASAADAWSDALLKPVLSVDIADPGPGPLRNAALRRTRH
jgi:hypothetical protein